MIISYTIPPKAPWLVKKGDAHDSLSQRKKHLQKEEIKKYCAQN